MEVFEITGFATGVSKEGVNYLQPHDSYQNLENGFIYRQVLQSRKGAGYFAPRLANGTRVFGIFEHILPDGTKELLTADTQQLYKFNTGSGVFDPVPFAGSMAAYTGFNISSNDFYISGTSYPTATNGARFVFTGNGIATNAAGSAVFFYNGTDVRDFTSVVDNPDYAAPLQGPLVRASFVVYMNERINFIVPEINSITYNQGVLYSGIRNSNGWGDQFDIAGSGLLQLSTYEYIKGCAILGQLLILCLNRSNWALEITRDAFNPWFSRKIPSVLGTDADFSPVSWNDTVKSLGKTGAIGTDGRQSLRIDNKIPNFTADDIDQPEFNLTYGGFDRVNNQFLWAYKDSEADTDTQNKVLVNNYEEGTWSVYDQRFSVFGQTDIGLNIPWDDIDEVAGNVAWAQWDTTEDLWDKIGLGESVQKTLAGDDLGFIYDINQDYDDYTINITAITQATSAVLTIGASAFQVGDRVAIYSVEGMTDINNFDPAESNTEFEPYIVSAATPTSITINVDSTLFPAATPNTGYVAKVISFKAETIPFNPYRSQGRRCYVSHVEFLIDTNGGNLRVDIIADEEESPFIDNVLLMPSTSTTKARQWITMTVNNEAEFHTFVMRQENPSTQVRVTSLRIHAEAGGMTSG